MALRRGAQLIYLIPYSVSGEDDTYALPDGITSARQ